MKIYVEEQMLSNDDILRELSKRYSNGTLYFVDDYSGYHIQVSPRDTAAIKAYVRRKYPDKEVQVDNSDYNKDRISIRNKQAKVSKDDIARINQMSAEEINQILNAGSKNKGVISRKGRSGSGVNNARFMRDMLKQRLHTYINNSGGEINSLDDFIASKNRDLG